MSIEDLEELREADRFRFANQLQGWVEVKDGRVVDYGQSGKGWIGSTTLQLGPKRAVFQAVALPDLQPSPEVTVTTVRFVQTCGGRTGVPAPRRVRRAPFVQFTRPAGVDDGGARDARGRLRRAPPDRGQPVPPPLGVRHRRQARQEERPDRFLQLVPQGLRQAQPVGRPGLAGVGDGGRVGARAPAVRSSSCTARPSHGSASRSRRLR